MFLRRADVAIMAICTGLIVANLYYCQPLIILIAHNFNVTPSVAGRVIYLTQAGYAAGLFFMVPLGDLLERKKQILYTTVLAMLSLLLAATAHSFLVLEIASFCIGFSSIVPQLILPLAAHLAEPAKRGKIIGGIMSGLLLGILLSRTLSGAIGAWLGWRSMFWIAVGICFILFLLMLFRFPQSKPHFKGTYGQLMRSLATLLPYHTLQEACITNALAFANFGAFWTTMVLLLASRPFYFNSGQIGLFGLVGAGGALAASFVGRMGDKRSPRITIGYGLFILLASFIVLYFSRTSVWGIIAGTVLLDLALQAVHVSNQTRIYALIPEARNRLNTIYMTASFIGTASGSAFGLWLWDKGGWTAVCTGCASITASAIVVYLLYHRRLSGASHVAS